MTCLQCLARFSQVHHRSSMRRNRSLVFRSFPYLESAQRMLLGVDQILKVLQHASTTTPALPQPN